MFEAFLPAMMKKNSGHVVALSSMAGICGLNNLVPYCGAKFAVRGIMEALREEFRLGVADSKVLFIMHSGLRIFNITNFLCFPA